MICASFNLVFGAAAEPCCRFGDGRLLLTASFRIGPCQEVVTVQIETAGRVMRFMAKLPMSGPMADGRTLPLCQFRTERERSWLLRSDANRLERRVVPATVQFILFSRYLNSIWIVIVRGRMS